MAAARLLQHLGRGVDAGDGADLGERVQVRPRAAAHVEDAQALRTLAAPGGLVAHELHERRAVRPHVAVLPVVEFRIPFHVRPALSIRLHCRQV